MKDNSNVPADGPPIGRYRGKTSEVLPEEVLCTHFVPATTVAVWWITVLADMLLAFDFTMLDLQKP